MCSCMVILHREHAIVACHSSEYILKDKLEFFEFVKFCIYDVKKKKKNRW